MKVRKSSWHYRLWKLGRHPSSQPVDLCRYFWHIALIKILIPLTLAGCVLFAVGVILYTIYGHPAQTAMLLLAVLFGAALVFGLFKLGHKLSATYTTRRRQRRATDLIGRRPKQPGLVRQMLWARKRAICPLIEVIDE